MAHLLPSAFLMNIFFSLKGSKLFFILIDLYALKEGEEEEHIRMLVTFIVETNS